MRPFGKKCGESGIQKQADDEKRAHKMRGYRPGGEFVLDNFGEFEQQSI